MTTQPQDTSWEVGAEVGSATFEITNELVEKHMASLGKSSVQTSPDGEIVVPTTILNWQVVWLSLPRMRQNAPAETSEPTAPRRFGGGNSGQEWEYYNPMHVGDRITLTANNGIRHVTGAGRVFDTMVVTAVNQKGEPICKVNYTRTYLTPAT